jgi:CRP-like cAMP-binding protein
LIGKELAMAQLVRASLQEFDKADGDHRGIGNIILRSLPRAERARIFPSLEFVRLRLHQVLHETAEVIRSGYFLNDGICSILTVQPDGESVEVGLIGKEGFVGLPVIFGFKTSALRMITQGDGTAYRVDVGILRNLLPHCPTLERQLQRYSMILGIQSTQLAACNRLHDVEERLARWLLMSHERIAGKTLPLTQEFLAQMLGTRRSTVSVAASILQKAGMISYTRGNVTILNKSKLEAASCDCYRMIVEQKNRWQSEAPDR